MLLTMGSAEAELVRGSGVRCPLPQMKLFKADDTMSAALPRDTKEHYLANCCLLDVPDAQCE